ncbi:hypothetical protein CANCADRAFT_56800 [Tortispora caseinolytica NRRL Y-17796]|uniref:Major facilitator superfamily (MFS) profile domain-containing protein n=1 Tax=Tortispora caseinolytica NRRL Y-17796 TaxID=767744 RepID=A0A1E4TEQ1_9ASCO|nr:hypothetical protein CANCADRAFT_56800 [Tortispora caseinolytica NRRL Y-17796]
MKEFNPTLNYTFVAHCIRWISKGKLLKYPEITIEDPHTYITPDGILEWTDTDPEFPRNWAKRYKIYVTIIITVSTFVCAFNTSALTGVLSYIEDAFQVNTYVSSLSVSLALFGYGLGPMIAGPMSEVPSIGRNGVYIPLLVIFAILQVPLALSHNIQTLLVLRFVSALCLSPMLSVAGATLGDMFRGPALAYSLGIWGSLSAVGPSAGPLVGSAIVRAGTWRWSVWIILIISLTLLLIILFFLPETSHEKLLRHKSARLRARHPTQTIMAPSDLAVLSLKRLATIYLVRPFEMLVREPIAMVLSLYLAFVYSLMFLSFAAVPYSFQVTYHWSKLVSTIPVTGMFVGVCVGLCIHIWWINNRYLPQEAKLGGAPPPEIYMFHACLGGPIVPISLLWFGWTSYPSIHWIVPVIGFSNIGFAVFCFFQSIMSYLTNAYPTTAASAIAANTFMRCVMASAFPIFTPIMYERLGVHWGSAVPAFAGILLLPTPFLIKKYGRWLRASSNTHSKDEENTPSSDYITATAESGSARSEYMNAPSSKYRAATAGSSEIVFSKIDQETFSDTQSHDTVILK